MPRSSRSFIAACDHAGCRSIEAIDGRSTEPKAALQAAGWYAIEGKAGKVAWLCPEHRPAPDAPVDRIPSKPSLGD